MAESRQIEDLAKKLCKAALVDGNYEDLSSEIQRETFRRQARFVQTILCQALKWIKFRGHWPTCRNEYDWRNTNKKKLSKCDCGYDLLLKEFSIYTNTALKGTQDAKGA